MLSRVVGNLKGVQLEAAVTLPDVVDAGDVGAHLVHHLHELRDDRERKALASRMQPDEREVERAETTI